jgi:hypothetical protein
MEFWVPSYSCSSSFISRIIVTYKFTALPVDANGNKDLYEIVAVLFSSMGML